MLQYLGLAWNPRNEEQDNTARLLRERHAARTPHWKKASSPGLFVSSVVREGSGQGVVILPGACGVVLGTLFELDVSPGARPTPCSSVGMEQTEEMLQTGGRSIVERFWGSYVLILRDERCERTSFIRGPMTQIRCFHVLLNGVHVFFSSVTDCVALRLVRFSINWDSIRAQAAHGDYLTQETAINEISAVECGECIQLTPAGVSRQTFWEPRSSLEQGMIDDYESAARSLRESVQYCVNAWAARHERILHTLSGGLDSSIVLSCLRRSPNDPRVVCLNYYSRDSGDERRYARSAAEHSATPLIERERNAQTDFRMFENLAWTVRPALNLSAFYSSSVNSQVAAELNCTALFDGEFGDNLFSRSCTQEVIVEYFRRHGCDRGLLKTALDYARARSLSVWKALSLAARDQVYWLTESSWSGYRQVKRTSRRANRLLVSQSTAQDYERQAIRFVHPWLKNMVGIPLGKFRMIYSILMITNIEYQAVFASPTDPIQLSPLASQPLVELAMRIPSHFHIHGGDERSLARYAFRSVLPEFILQRGRGKGTSDCWIRDTIQRNKRFLEEYLLDGVLVKERILDRNKVEAVLAADVRKDVPSQNDILWQLYIEAWLRKWLGSAGAVEPEDGLQRLHVASI